MRIRIHTTAEAADYLLTENKLFSAQFYSATDKGVALDVLFPSSADSETIALAFFLAGQSYTMKQVKKIFSNENNLSHQPM